MSNERESRHPNEGEVPLEEIRHPETLYDRSDLSARGIVGFLIGLAITILLIHIVIWGFLRFFSRDQLIRPPRSAAIITPEKATSRTGESPVLRFPAPQLQPDPVADLNKFRASVEEQLNSSGPGRIPIAQAMEMLSQQGLPVRQPPALPPRADFGSGSASVAGAGGGTEPRGSR